MSDKKAVTVTIYGNEYTLKGEADPNYIAELAKYVDGKMNEIGKKSSAPAAKVAILASMNIADEYHRLEKAKNENLKLIETLEKNLLEMKKSSDGSLKHSLEQKEQLDKAKTEAMENKKKIEEATAELLKLKKDSESGSKVFEQQKGQLENAQKAASSHRAELEKLKEEIEKLKGELSEEKAKAHEVIIEEEDFKSQVSHLNAELAKTKEALERAKQEAEKARHTKPTQGPSTPGASFLPSDEKLASLFKKIDAILE